MLSQALGRLLAIVEAYPDLKANQNFLALQNELTATEDRIASARRYYNATVRDLNTKVETVPSNIIAGVVQHRPRRVLRGRRRAARGPAGRLRAARGRHPAAELVRRRAAAEPPPQSPAAPPDTPPPIPPARATPAGPSRLSRAGRPPRHCA